MKTNFYDSIIEDNVNGTVYNEDMEVKLFEIIEKDNIKLTDFNFFARPVHNLLIYSTH